jgi:hypothetical protein
MLEHRPGGASHQLHDGLVGLDLGEHITDRDRLALLLFPLHQAALLHSGGEGFHHDVRRHAWFRFKSGVGSRESGYITEVLTPDS